MDNYSFVQSGNTFIVSLDNGCSVASTLQRFCGRHGIRAGIIRGIGAVDRAVLRFFNPSTKVYEDHVFEEQMEIASLEGNVSGMDGEVYLHLHVVLGRSDCSALAGHLLDCRLSGAGEIFVTALDCKAQRRHEPTLGLNVYDF